MVFSTQYTIYGVQTASLSLQATSQGSIYDNILRRGENDSILDRVFPIGAPIQFTNNDGQSVTIRITSYTPSHISHLNLNIITLYINDNWTNINALWDTTYRNNNWTGTVFGFKTGNGVNVKKSFFEEIRQSLDIVTLYNPVDDGSANGGMSFIGFQADANLDMNSKDIRNVVWNETHTTTCSQHIESEQYKGKTYPGNVIDFSTQNKITEKFVISGQDRWIKEVDLDDYKLYGHNGATDMRVDYPQYQQSRNLGGHQFLNMSHNSGKYQYAAVFGGVYDQFSSPFISYTIGLTGNHNSHSFTNFHYCKNLRDISTYTDSEIQNALLGKVFKTTDTPSMLVDGSEVSNWTSIATTIYDNALTTCELNDEKQNPSIYGILNEIIDKDKTQNTFDIIEAYHQLKFSKPTNYCLYKLASKGDGFGWVVLQVGSGDIVSKGDILQCSNIREGITLSPTYSFNGAIIVSLSSQTLTEYTASDTNIYYRIGTSTLGFRKNGNGMCGSMYETLTTTPNLIRTFTSFNEGTNIWTDGVVNYEITGWTKSTDPTQFGGFLEKQTNNTLMNYSIAKANFTLTEGNVGSEGLYTNSSFTQTHSLVAFGGDDDDTMVQLPSGAFGGNTFQYFGSSYSDTDINIASNGYIGVGTNQTAVSSTINDFDDYRRIGICSLDLRLRSSLGSQIRYRLGKEDNIENCVFILQYYKIGEFTSATNENTLEIRFYLNNAIVSKRGRVEMAFIQLQSINHSIVVGLSNGSNTNPASQDLSAGITNTSTPMEEFSSGTIDLLSKTLSFIPNGANYDVSCSDGTNNNITTYKKFKVPLLFI